MQKLLAGIAIPALSPEGFGKTERNGRDLLVIGALPGEVMDVRVVKKRKSKVVAVPETITTPHPDRGTPREDHYLSCSPWQGIPYTTQIQLKRQMVLDAYTEAGVADMQLTEYIPATEIDHYRTKVEFSFWHTDDGLQLAFHERGKPFVNIPAPQGCLLASEASNRVAIEITKRLDAAGIQRRVLKTVIVRESKTENKRIAVLYVTDENFLLPFALADIIDLHGLMVAYSNPLSPVSRIDSILLQEGEMNLTEHVDGLSLAYSLDSFFQNNIPLFEQALQRMKHYLKRCHRLVELYSGVGAIGLALADHADEVVGIEIVPEAIRFARENALHNKISNYTCADLAAEHMDSNLLADTDVLILDPPRTGLHTDVIRMITEHRPKRIMYLSCNPVTQARDYASLRGSYRSEALFGFDFYPNTLHQESLLILGLDK